jgi:hypothetical protein
MIAVRLHRAPAAAPTPAYEHELGRVLRLAQEGFYWQGEVEDLLIAIRDDGDLADLSRAGGPIMSRFEAMRMEARAIGHPDRAATPSPSTGLRLPLDAAQLRADLLVVSRRPSACASRAGWAARPAGRAPRALTRDLGR